MRSAIVMAAIVFSSAQAFASDPAILVCEAALKSTLKAPKTYERVSADLTGRSVYLTYDAVNSFNAPLRGKHKCDFNLMGDIFLLSDNMEQEYKLSEIRKRSREGLNDAEKLAKFRSHSVEEERFEKALIAAGDAEDSARETGLYPIPTDKTGLK